MARKARASRKGKSQTTRKASQQANIAGSARRVVRARLVALEARLTVLERLCWEHLAPDTLASMDEWLQATHPILSQEAEEE